jgi:hypothetical protein
MKTLLVYLFTPLFSMSVSVFTVLPMGVVNRTEWSGVLTDPIEAVIERDEDQ